MKRWDVAVLPLVLNSDTDEEARIEFVLAVRDDPSLIHVSEHFDDIDVDLTGTDAFGV